MEIGIDHIGLSVADLESERDFYARAFDFRTQIEFDLAPHPIRGVMLAHPCGFRLELFQHERSAPAPASATPVEALATRGYGHFALAAADIQALHDTAVAAGARSLVPPSPSPEPGVRFAFVADPEGHLVELVERSPA